jgi:hypothetical protein
MKTGIFRQQSAKIGINVKICIFRLCETELIFFCLCVKQAHILNFFVYLQRIKSRHLHEHPLCIISENKSCHTTEKLETSFAD